MCSTVLIAGMVAMAAISAATAYQQSSMAQAQAKYNRKVSENQALDARQRADVEADEKRRQIAQTIGAARARQAANGLLVDDTMDSTNSALIDDLIVAGHMDILRIYDNGEREARGFDQRAELSRIEAANESPGLAAGLAGGASLARNSSVLVG